jgi:PAS domain S-box-containing protein
MEAPRSSKGPRGPAVRLPARGDDTLEQALAKAGDGAFAVAEDGCVRLWNRAAERILGWTAREVVERPCCEILEGIDGNGNRLCYRGCHVMSLAQRGEPVQHFEMQTRTKAGRLVWLDVSVLEVPTADREKLTVHLFRDVTATKVLLELVRDRLRPSESSSKGTSPLSRRESEILRLMAAGANTKVLAERLHVSPATVRNHAQNIFTKLGVHSRLEAVAWANRNRLG